MILEGVRRFGVLGLGVLALFFLGGPVFVAAGSLSGSAVHVEGGPLRLLVDVLLGLAALRAARRLWSDSAQAVHGAPGRTARAGTPNG